MSKKEVRQAAAELTERLCEKDFLDRSGLSRKNVMMLMNKDHWEEQFAHIFPIKKRISCRAVYEICEEPLSLLGHEPEEGWMKVIFWSNPLTINELEKYISRHENPDANFMMSSIWSLEMLQKGTHKGMGVMWLADKLGVEKSHVAAIGDYYNDWDMLKTVGLPACAGQAPKPIHKICKFEACHCNHGCVGDLLEYIMSGKAEEDIAANAAKGIDLK